MLTQIEKEDLKHVLERVNNEFVGNTNSIHSLGSKSKSLEEAATKQIINVLKLDNDKEIIYTSGRCESNNLLIFGLLDKYSKKSKNIITTETEHSSVLESLKHLDDNFEIRYLSSFDGKIKIEELKSLIDENTILVSISNVLNIEEIATFLKLYNCYYHIDITSKGDINYNLIDFITISDNDLPGIGLLIKNKKIVIEPLFHGGKSTTNYRSGTPVLPFIVAISKLIKIKYNSY